MEEYIYEENNNLKLPENTGINWLENKLNSGELNIKTKIADTCRYLSDFISVDEIAAWTSQVPVFISAQTGAGKNYFIQNVLLRKIIEDNRDRNGIVPRNLMLILSNRIALSRQTKVLMAKFLIYAIGNSNYADSMKKLYTAEGLDELCIDFGVITICSYHQMLKKGILENNYKYIVCDEFHFFTSDAVFNNSTDKMLKEIVLKGKNSVRVYMSATPEIAMPVVLTEEWKIAHQKFVEIVHGDYGYSLENYKKDLESAENVIHIYNLVSFSKKKKKKKQLNEKIQNLQNEIFNIQRKMEKELSGFALNVNFYYMKRNYNYIDKIYEYRTTEELVEGICNSASKWLVFVPTIHVGENLKQKLTDKKIDCKLMTRKTVDTTMQVKDEYDYLILEGNLKTRVLIATSIIDNGINITNIGDNIKSDKDKVLNIAIDTFDRTEFIQMLGRVRITEDDKISLYIKHHSVADVKEILLQNAKELLTRLQVDFNPYYNEDIFDSKVFRIENGQMRYNECAVWELVGRMIPQLLFLKNNSQYSVIKFSSERDEAMREQIYNYYKYNEHGREIKWSRNIVDLLESEYGYKNRNQYIEEDIYNGCDGNRYQPKLITFIQWQYQTLLPEYYERQMQKDYNFFIECLSCEENNYFHYLYNKNYKINSTYGKLKCLSETFEHFSKPFSMYTNKYATMWNSEIFYYNLATSKRNISTIEEKLQWLELPNAEVSPLQIKPEKEEMPDTLEELVKKYSMPITEINENCVNGSKDIKKGFFQNCGILKDSELATNISEKFFNGLNLTNLINNGDLMPNEIPYELKSFREQTTRKTYYIFVSKEL